MPRALRSASDRSLGVSSAPLFLRIALGITFLWAGIGKMEATMKVKGEQAATLATMGVQRIRDEAPPNKTIRPQTTDVLPANPAPEGSIPTPGPSTTPAPAVPAVPPAAPPAAQPPPATQPTPETTPTDPTPPDVKPAALAAGPIVLTLAQVTAPSISPGAGQPDPNRIYSAAEFPDDIELPRVYGLALLLHKAANPPAPADQSKANAMMNLWPRHFGRGMWPVRLAWAVAVTEVIAGLFVLVGLLTRASALALAGTMLGAIWLTEVGPAIQAGATILGFLPDRDPFAIDAWRPLLWQLSLLMSAFALLCLGSGPLGFDRRLFPPPPPAPPTPRPML